MELRDYLLEVTNARSMEELWALHTAKMAEYGFTRLLYGFSHYMSGASLGDPEDFILLTNHCEEYLDGFIHNGLYFHAPMLHWVLRNEGAASWRMLTQMMESETMTANQRRVYEFNAKMGVTYGYTISFKSISARSKGAISLCAHQAENQDQVDAVWDRHGKDIILMNNVAHLKILTLPYVGPNRVLTKRQREVLQWVSDGKTTQDIATLMDLTQATVEKHLRLARESLSVETTAQAVLKASMQNQIFVFEA